MVSSYELESVSSLTFVFQAFAFCRVGDVSGDDCPTGADMGHRRKERRVDKRKKKFGPEA